MAQSVEAVVTNAWRSKIAEIYSGGTDAAWDNNGRIFKFKMGEGGWTDPGGGKEPVPPDPALTDMTASGYPAGSQYVFEKTLTPSDLDFVPALNRLEIRCFVDPTEANDDGGGNPPEFFELGIFDEGGTMLVYSTFPLEIKTPSKALEHLLFVDF